MEEERKHRCHLGYKCLGSPELCAECRYDVVRPNYFREKNAYVEYMEGTGREPDPEKAREAVESNATRKDRLLSQAATNQDLPTKETATPEKQGEKED